MPATPATPKDRHWSLRSRLYLVAGLAVLLAWVGGGLAMLVAAKDASERLCRENLANLAHTVLGFAAHELEEIRADAGGALPDVVHRETATTLPARYAYQIWSARGELLLRSVHAPGDRRLTPPGFTGFDTPEVDGRKIEVFALTSKSGEMTVIVADTEDDGVFEAVFGAHFAAVMAVLLPAVLGGTWWMLRHALAPLLRTSRELGRRGPHGLAPLPLDGAPAELRAIIDAVNRLLVKVDDALSQEREFTALAAHELRTPLASLRVQAQVLARSRDPAEHRHELAALEVNVDRCTRMLNQMLALARADALRPENLQHEWIDTGELVAEVLADFVVVAGQRGIEVECELNEARLFADRVLLQTLLRNLLSNAIRHAPDGGRVRVCSARRGGTPRLAVEDSGPGIPDHERARVFERFYRGAGERGPGVGLGLAIVAAIARAHGARIGLASSELGGLRVELSLPRPAPADGHAGGAATLAAAGENA
ncbi:MAG: sensor histidine kinase N-terminal domain-containing protein [Rubrivivax sp.]|nr:sensor histidine kinase N-terminal domain-containing protein [Rubrivivax sp.]